MAYETNSVEMQTNTRGGVMKGFGRMFAGESMFMANYTALEDNQLVAFASTVPGNIIPINMDDFKEELIVQKNAFLCAQQSVNMNVVFTKRFGAGLFGGEGLFLTRLVGPGKVIIQSQNFQDFAGRITPYISTKN